ncbi:apoptosis regulator BAX-like [Littorina saxatilis]|uniref:Bcl-2 Bcl-2 homology region 1-3 domain-containing protein n=1 Tax=Littorina saxatilis TaxID=31220 RepID=A0AAN9G8N1_9CAEN
MASKMQQPSAFFPTEEERKTQKDHLNTNDVANQGRLLLNSFIHDRMVRDGIINAPVVSDLQEPGTPCGPPMHHSREIARALRCIGDELDRDQKLQELVKKVPPEAERKTFYSVASQIFSDGVFNWGRVVALFYFAYKVCVKALDRVPLIRAIINLIVDIIRDKLAQWIIDRGGWEAIREYFGATWQQVAVVTGAGMAVAAGIYFYNKS